MNAFTQIHAEAPTKAERLIARAQSILAGDIPKADYPVFTRQQWMDEAQAVLDTRDDTELQWMIDHQDEADREEHQARVDAWWDRVAPSKRSWMENSL